MNTTEELERVIISQAVEISTLRADINEEKKMSSMYQRWYNEEKKKKEELVEQTKNDSL